jgi:flotillin
MIPASALLLQGSVLDGINIMGVVLPAVGAVAVAGLTVLFVSRYRRCPANRVLVISGRVGGDGTARCISGGGAFIWPVIQEYAYLSLEPIQIDIPLKDALSLENIRVAVPSVFTVAVGTEAEVRQNAAVRLLGLTHDQIKRQAQDIIFGQLRQVIASMNIEQINRDREAFLHRILTSLEPELKKIGLVLINVNITDLKDDSGYIEAIGKKAAAMAVQQARGDVADQEKLGEVRVAEAERERSVQVATAVKFREIGMREADRDKLVRLAEMEKEQRVGEQTAALQRDTLIKEAERTQAVRMAELDRDQQIGEQRAAFERDAQIKDAERARRVSIAEYEAKAIDGEATSQALVATTRATLQVREAEAYQLSETKKREAEAAVQEAGFRAMARAALADAERVEAEQRAKFEATAKAAKATTIVEAEANAERVRIGAEAEAQAIYIKLEAEARGQYEIMSKKADAMKELVAAAGGAKEAFQLMMVEHLDTLAETSAKAISNIKFDKIVVWDSGSGGKSATSGFLQSMANTLPPMMNVLRDIAGVELPGYLGKMEDGDGTSAAAGAPAELTLPVPEALPPARKGTKG